MGEKINFEDNIKELEEIVSKLEKNDIALDESLNLFERGIKLSRQCSKMLDEAEKKVSVLLNQGDNVIKQDFLLGDEE